MDALPREERILNLLSALLAAQSPLPYAEIRDQVSGYDDPASPEALEKRFDRDKSDLRAAGVPLVFISEDDLGRSGYVVRKDEFFLDEIRFTVEEGIVLAALQRAAATREGDPFEESLRTALTKIGVDSPLTAAFRESVGEQQLLDPRLPSDREKEGDALPILAEALATRRAVRFMYYTLGSGETRERDVEPYGIGYSHGRWYLVGRDVRKKEERVFRTSRIIGPVEIVKGKHYGIPANFKLRDRVGLPPWEFGDGPRVEVWIRFHQDIAWMMEENLRPGQSFSRSEDGSGVLTVPASDPDALVNWVAQYGPTAEILAPEDLRARMRDHLQGALERYAP